MANGRLALFACIFDGIGNLVVQWTQAGPASWNHEWEAADWPRVGFCDTPIWSDTETGVCHRTGGSRT